MADQQFDPETLARLAALTDDTNGFFHPNEQLEMMQRRAKAMQMQLAFARHGVDLAPDPGFNMIHDIANPKNEVSLDHHHAQDQEDMADTYDVSPFISSGFQGKGPASMNGFGDSDADRMFRKGVPDFHPSADSPLSGSPKMQLEEPDEEMMQKRKAALAAMGGK